MNPVDARLFFMDLWMEHRFRVDLVARLAGVPDETIFTMLSYQPVGQKEAQKVLAALSALYHREYTLFTVSVRLHEEGEKDVKTANKVPCFPSGIFPG